MEVDGDAMRKAILEALAERAAESKPPGGANSDAVLTRAGQKLHVGNDTDMQRAVLAYWHSLVCGGHVAWGKDFHNSAPPWCHLTDRGRATLKHLSRDPANPEGYMQHLKGLAPLSPVALSYIEEALKTYATCCYKATAVMVGAAAERMALDLRDALEAKMQATGRKLPKGLKDWRVKTAFEATAGEVRAALERSLKASPDDATRKLLEALDAYLSAFVYHLRATRNDAGHPGSIDLVTPEAVHAALLMFPGLSELATKLQTWVRDHYA